MKMLKKPKRAMRQNAATAKRKVRNATHAIDYKVLAQFRYQLRLFLEQSANNAGNARLTSQQYQALLAIKGASGEQAMSVGELAQSLLIKHHTTVELVDRMVKLGLLRRTSDPDDHRRVFVTLTSKGNQRLEKVATVNVQHLQSSGQAMSRIFKLFRRSGN